MTNLDERIERILTSYEEFGGINLTDNQHFPNRQTVVRLSTWKTSFSRIPGKHFIDRESLRFVTGERLHRVPSSSPEVLKAIKYICEISNAGKGCYKYAEQIVLAHR